MSLSTDMHKAKAAKVKNLRQRALMPTLVAVAAVVAIMSSLGAPVIPSIARADKVLL